VRLFVAVELAPALAAAAGALIEELRGRAARLAPHSRITWVAADRLHLTVAFIGDADDARSDAIREALAAPIDVRPFDLTVAGTGAFPKTGQPRVLWAGLTTGRDALLRVERVVTPRLADARIVAEPRAYNPHLTLGRVRDAAGLKAVPLFAGLEDAFVGTTRVEAITLFDSRLSSKGPTYVSLQRTALG
jgi:2'-5' RNA ligase